jgi:hypothetical protein
VDTGFPQKDMRQRMNLERIRFHQIGMRSSAYPQVGNIRLACAFYNPP